MAISKENIRIKITVPKEVNNKLKIKAELEQRSISNYVFNLIMKNLESK